eukprot:scaffold21170_cov32-Tisochrysis_lutea.AAC.2
MAAQTARAPPDSGEPLPLILLTGFLGAWARPDRLLTFSFPAPCSPIADGLLQAAARRQCSTTSCARCLRGCAWACWSTSSARSTLTRRWSSRRMRLTQVPSSFQMDASAARSMSRCCRASRNSVNAEQGSTV